MIRQLVGDCRQTLPILDAGVAQAVITSPPYFGLRDYGTPPLVWGGVEHEHEWGVPNIREFGRPQGQTGDRASRTYTCHDVATEAFCDCGAWLGSLGLEPTPELYIEHLVECFRHVRRVLRDDGMLWLNLGDSYASGWSSRRDKSRVGWGSVPLRDRVNRLAGLKEKDLVMMPFRVAMALQADGWWLRSVIPWLKRNSMPESVQGSHWSRHKVTIEEYENLSGLPYTGECSRPNWPGDMPDLQTRPVLGSKAPVSAKSEGASDSTRTRATGGREGETPPVLGIRPRSGKQREVPANSEGQSESGETGRQLSLAGEVGGGSPDSPRLASDLRPPQVSVPLLRQAPNADDVGSRNPTEQGRSELAGERGPGVPFVQLKKEGQVDPTLLVGCPGCAKCEANGGYVFHLSAGRPSTSVEYVFLFSKSASYFWNADAVRIASDPARTSWAPGKKMYEVHDTTGRDVRNDGLAALAERMNNGQTGRNRRNSDWFFESWQGLMLDEADDPLALVVNPTGFKQAHFATFPAKLVEPMVKASTRPGDTVLDPFSGAGTVGLVADRLGRNAILCELKVEYASMGADRIVGDAPLFSEVAAD